ncbi:MAG: TonB-dependent receptor [Pricia sp.]
MKIVQSHLLRAMLLLLPIGILAQTTVTGTITALDTGEPLPGVSIIIQGTSTGTTTDFDGNYTIEADQDQVLQFSYIGFKNQEATVSGATLDVSMDEDAQELDEVVVIGYGTVKKEDATGSVTAISPKEFNKGAVVAADQLIQGKVSGIQVTSNGGSPGDGARIRIRSGSSLNANNDPLYVIDGVPVDSGGIEGGRNPLATINQNDIESINILKDASATAIYGVRASNGVVIITTKRGKSGELQVALNSSFSIATLTDQVDLLSPSQFTDYVLANGNETQVTLPGNQTTDWQELIYRDAFGTDQNVSLTGGKDLFTYRLSGGFSSYEGILRKDRFNRTTLSTALTFNLLDDHLKIDVNNNTAFLRNNYSDQDAIGAASRFDPTQPVFVDDQTYGGYFRYTQSNGNLNPLAPANPLAIIEQKTNLGRSYRSIGNVQFDYKMHFLPELKATLNLGYDYLSGRAFGGEDDLFTNPGQPGSSYNNLENKENRVMDAYFNYNKDFESIKTLVDVTAGYNYQDFRYFTDRFSDDGSGVQTEIINNERLNLQSFFARANITHNDKYLFTFSIRRDGTSRFTEENRWGNFPAAALAWKLGNENFLKDSNVISELKLRASWGITGQQEVGDRYPSLPLYQSGTNTASYQFGNQFIETLRPQPFNTNLVWEETETFNVGLDFGFFNGRFTGTIDAYERTTNDLIVFTNNPQGVGFSNADDYNIGTLENKGLEMAADVYPIQNEDWTWRLGGNITFQESKITQLTLVDDPNYTGIDVGGIDGGTGNTIQNHQVGFAPFSFFVFEQAYDANGSPLEGVYIDRNGDGIVNSNDKYRFRKPAPDVYYGFNTDLNYQNWFLNMSWRGSWGNYNYNNIDSARGNGNSILVFDNVLTNGVTNLLETNFRNPQFLSDYYIQDASFVRLDNASLGYTFDDVFREGSSVTVTATGQNLILISDYKGIDPEASGDTDRFGIDNNIYPRPRTFLIGFNVNF